MGKNQTKKGRREVLKFFLIGLMGIGITACSSFSDSEIIVKANPDKKRPKYDYMPPVEKPIENHLPADKYLPIVPQLGIRIPLGK